MQGDSVKMAVILHLIYGSADLALQVLAAYDSKMQTGIAATYYQRLTA